MAFPVIVVVVVALVITAAVGYVLDRSG